MKLSFILLLLGWATQAVAQQPGDYEITGQATRLAGQTLYLLAPVRPSHSQRWPVLDSARADAEGRFALRGQVPAPDVYCLRVGQRGPLCALPLANRQERVLVQVATAADTPAGTMYDLLATGTPELALLRTFNKYALLRYEPARPGSRQLPIVEGQLRANAGTYLAPYLTFHFLRLQPSARPLLDSLTERFAREQPATSYLPRLRELQAAGQRLATGAEAPDFALPGLDGKPLALSSLRGSYVLVDFWASWCGPCRAENPNLLAAYRKYQNKSVGFTVLSVSLDERAADWRRALVQDALPWPQVADLAGFQGTVGPLYNIVGIPATFLLDPQGRIVATNLRGPALAKELAKYLR